MPRIQLQTLPTVAPQQGPSPRFNLDARGAFGEEVAGAVQQASGLLARHAIEAKQSADVARVEEAETELERRHQGRLYGAKDRPGTGFLFQQGHAAIEGSADLLEQLEKDQREVEDGLQDEAQRRAFRRRTQGTVVQRQRQIEAYVGAQRGVVEGQAFESRRAVALDAIANGFDQPAVVARERQNLEPLVLQEARRRGLEGAPPAGSPDLPDPKTPAGALLSMWRREVARTVVERFLDARRPGEAEKAFEEALGRGDIDPGIASQLQARINREMGDAIALSAAMEAASEKTPAGLVDLGRGQARLDKRQDLTPAQRLQAQAIFDDRVRIAQRGFDQRLGQAVLAAKAAWENGDPARGIAPYTNPEISVPKSVQKVLRNPTNPGGPDAWEALLGWHTAYVNRERTNAQLPTAEQVALAATLEADIIRETTRGGALYRSMPAEAFVGMWASKLPLPLFQRVWGLFLDANKATGEKVPQIVGDKDMLLQELPEKWRPAGRGIDPKKPATWSPNTRHGAAYIELSEELAAWRLANRDAGEKDARDFVRSRIALKLGEVLREKQGRWGKPGQVYGFEARRRTDIDASNYTPDLEAMDVADEDAARVRARYRDRGLPDPTDMEIRQVLWRERAGAPEAAP